MARQLAASSLGASPHEYLYTIAVAADKQTYATIGSDDSLTIFDLALRPLGRTKRAHDGVSCLAAHANGFVTAGRDGRLRSWDARAQRAGLDIATPRDGSGLSALACEGHLVAAGTESTREGLGDVDVLLYDVRHPAAPLRRFVDSHSDAITQLRFHPALPHVLLSGSDDGLISLFDARAADEDDALQLVLNPRAGVHCAGFLAPRCVYAVTADESFLVYNLPSDLDAASPADDAPSVHDVGDVRGPLRCAYVIDVLPGPEPIMAVGHNIEQTLRLVQLDPGRNFAFGAVVDLPGAHGDDVVRDVLVRTDIKRALSCGEDGVVRVWDLSRV